MDLSFDLSLAQTYKSNTQRARVLTENWVAKNSYCPNCGYFPMTEFENNRPVADFICLFCKEEYELKSKAGKFSPIIPDGAYDTMLSRIQSDNNPSFFFLNYTRELKVSNFIVVPKHFVTSDIIIKRKPLSETARRAGWIGCQIDTSKISSEGKIHLIQDGMVIEPELVHQKFQKTLFLREKSIMARGWLLEMMKCLDKIDTREFSLEQVYAFESELSKRYPTNQHIKDKIRQQLQVLRDKELIEFLGGGRYRKL